MQKRYLEAGKIVTTHALKGEVKIQPWCDSADVLTGLEKLYFDKGKTEKKIVSAKQFKGMAIIGFEGVCSVEEANLLRGKIVYADRADLNLEEGAYFIQDLIGMTVRDGNTDRVYGKICEVSPTGANDVYHIKNSEGKITLIPAIKQVIKNVDLENEVMLITPMEGLFEDED